MFCVGGSATRNSGPLMRESRCIFTTKIVKCTFRYGEDAWRSSMSTNRDTGKYFFKEKQRERDSSYNIIPLCHFEREFLGWCTSLAGGSRVLILMFILTAIPVVYWFTACI